MTAPSVRMLVAALALALAGEAGAQGKGREEADGERVVGAWGAAFFGQRTFDFGTFAGGPHAVDVYTIGVRHWMPGAAGGPFKGWGVDAGLGFGWSHGKHQDSTVGGTPTLESSDFGLGLHGGLPLALARTRHVTFLLVPEIDLLWASGSSESPGVPPAVIKTDWSGFALDLGARAGVELHLGFVGVPELSLQGSLGAAFRYAETTRKPPGVELTDSAWRLGTDRPAGLVVGNVAVIYYF
jgi:hypothetical protein